MLQNIILATKNHGKTRDLASSTTITIIMIVASGPMQKHQNKNIYLLRLADVFCNKILFLQDYD